MHPQDHHPVQLRPTPRQQPDIPSMPWAPMTTATTCLKTARNPQKIQYFQKEDRHAD